MRSGEVNMKRVFKGWPVFLCCVLALSLAGCSSEVQESASVDQELQAHEDSLSSMLSGDVPVLSLSVGEEDGIYSLRVSVGASGKVSSFGDYVLATREAFETEFDADSRDCFSVSMAVTGNSMLRFSSDGYSDEADTISGLFSDTRSGSVVTTQISSLDDLFEKFPAARLYAENHKIEQ